MQWTDQIRRVKIFLVLAAVIIAVASLVVSHILFVAGRNGGLSIVRVVKESC